MSHEDSARGPSHLNNRGIALLGSTGETDRIYWLFDTPKDLHQASCRRAAILRDPQFSAGSELVKAMEQLNEEKFPKLMAYLKNPVGRRVGTNNHVERTNRMIRLLEKVRYKWRRRRALVRHPPPGSMYLG